LGHLQVHQKCLLLVVSSFPSSFWKACLQFESHVSTNV
jgi:hypothetical protein